MLEIDADEPADDELLAVLREARDAGFRIALDGFPTPTPTRCWTSPTASSSTSPTLDEDAIEAAVNVARGRGLDVIADGVETRDDTASAAASASTPSRASTSPSR